MAGSIDRANSRAAANYSREGAGIGADAEALKVLEEYTSERVQENHTCLEIGFGQGKLVEQLACHRRAKVIGFDIAMASLHADSAQRAIACGAQLYVMDASHEEIGLPDDYAHYAFCTETIEHLSNPFFMCAEVKRVLVHGGYFTLSFPMPEDNLGYGGGQHAHVYPGFLRQDSWESFCRQLYFKSVHFHSNGSSAWYVLKNYKGPGVKDVFSMTSANYDERELFQCLEGF